MPGDFVLIVFDERYNHFRVVLDGTHNLHFLHVDSYHDLGLKKPKLDAGKNDLDLKLIFKYFLQCVQD